jgi:hypothetical protein
MNRAQDRPEVQTARQAAEALFRPNPQVAPVEMPMPPETTPSPSTEPTAPRKPRIFSTAPVTAPPAKEPEVPVSSTVTQRHSDIRPKAQKIPKSAHGRIRTLVMYGMTIEDVADLYGVAVSAIALIVSK